MGGKPTNGGHTYPCFFQGFAHGFGNDGFLPMVFCRFGQGNYGYVLIQGYGLGFMNDSTCIYMYCNIERNIMKNQSGSSSFGV